MSHDETFMSHRETSDAAGNLPEIRRKIGKAPGKSKNGRKLPVRRPGEPAICSGPRDRAGDNRRAARPGRQRLLVPFPDGPRRSRRESQRSRGSRPLSTRCSAAPQIPPAFSDPAPAPAPTPPAMSQMGHFCLMNEPGFDRANPRSPGAPLRAPCASAVQPLSVPIPKIRIRRIALGSQDLSRRPLRLCGQTVVSSRSEQSVSIGAVGLPETRARDARLPARFE